MSVRRTPPGVTTNGALAKQYARSYAAQNFIWGVPPAAADVARTSLLLIFAFAGIEVALVPSGEVRDTARTVPRAIALAMLAITTPDAVLDGEICSLDDEGRSRFSLLQEGGGIPVLALFDLLELEGEPLVDLPLQERRERLQQVVGSDGGVIVSPQFDDGPALLAAARQQGLEGVVAKKVDSQYKPGRRSPEWHKLKLRRTQELNEKADAIVRNHDGAAASRRRALQGGR